MLTTILSILGSIIPVILQNSGVIGSSTATLITNLLSPVETLIANLKSGQPKMQDALAILAAVSGAITVLKANTALSPDVLTEVNNIDLDVQKALAAYVQAEKGLDLTIYQPIAPVS